MLIIIDQHSLTINYAQVVSINYPHASSNREDVNSTIVIIPVSQMNKLRLREVRGLPNSPQLVSGPNAHSLSFPTCFSFCYSPIARNICAWSHLLKAHNWV